MFQLIKAIIEPVTKALSVSELLARRDRKHPREVGTELFVFYSSANEILVLGDHIVHEIESGCSWMKRKLDEGKPDETLGTGLSFWLGGLTASLIKAVHAIKRLGLKLQIIDRVSYAALVPLIHGGHSPTMSLIYTCGDDFGAGLVAYDEHLLLGIDNFNAAAEAFEPTIDPVRMTRIMRSSFRQMQMNIDVQRTVLRGLSSIPARRLSEFQNYLEDEKPRERLAAIEQALEGLRNVLEKNFSIADVLLNVRDIRACPEDPFGLSKWF